MWHEKEAALSVIIEQLKTPIIGRILRILDTANSQISASFDHYKDDFEKFYAEARDNVKFLYSLLRHFKVSLRWSL